MTRTPSRRFTSCARRAARVRALGAAWLGAACTAALLVACSSPDLPPVQWVHLPLLAPGVAASDAANVSAGAANTATRAAQVWQLMMPVTLPGHLDRDALLVPQGATGLQPLAGVRWAEPLRDAVPRLLRTDLAAALGQPVWASPLPPGVVATRQIRIELLALDVASGRSGVTLQAQWSVATPGSSEAPLLGHAHFTELASGPGADALVLAHRAALTRLAQQVTQQAR